MDRPDDTELIDRFEEFYRSYYRNEIADLAQKYPSEQKSLYIDWRDLSRFDTDLADDFRNKPTQMRRYAEEALRLYDLPVDVSLGQAHVRVTNLSDTTGIRDIRSDQRGMLITVTGIIRKATDVRPKVITAAFECQRCGTLTRIPQDSGEFQEPHECQGCERQGPFQINYDQSEFIDAQKLRVQESPEGLRGGETPQSIDVNIEDDITGEVTPGDHVSVTGVLKLEQQGNQQEKSPMFDIYMDGLTVEIEDEQFEEMDITDADKKEIIELSNEPDIYDRIQGAIAPSIYGYETEKLAMALQLFSGVTKFLPDGSRTRGDLHMLLIGDPGTGKCQRYDTDILLADGRMRKLGDIVEEHLDDPVQIADGYRQETDIGVLTTDGETVQEGRATQVWKREAPDRMYRIRTASGHELEVTPSHPLFVQENGRLAPSDASELSEREFIAVPRRLPSVGNDTLDIDDEMTECGASNSPDLPEELTKGLSRLLGYVIGEGNVADPPTSGDIRIPNADEEILEDVSGVLDDLGLRYRVEATRRTDARVVRCSSVELVRALSALEPAILEGSDRQRVPDVLFRASRSRKRAFLRAYVADEGQVSSTERAISITSTSEQLLEGVRTLLLSFGISSQLHPRPDGGYRLRMSDESAVQYVSEIGFVTEQEARTAEQFAGTPGNTNTEIVPGIQGELRRIRERLGLSQSDCGVPQSTYQHYERGDRNPSGESLRTVVSTFERRLVWLSKARARVSSGNRQAVGEARQELNISQLAAQTDVTQGTGSPCERGETVSDGGVTADVSSAVLDRIDEALAVEADVTRLRSLIEGDLGWNRIESIETVEPDYEWVYDLEVAGTHNYIANGVVSHNSAMLQYVENIAPRSVYTSGKGATSAGLTAAAVRDDFGDGQQWTLEAGALVLADQGIAAVDELDKMSSDDQSAMHQALEEQSISVNKAGINATLKSRCSLLGAANPTMGRFDKYEPIAEQIDLSPPLISRFDLIFTVTDQPDPEEDAKLAEHILQTNYAGELHTHRTEANRSDYTADEVDRVTDEVAPTIEPELLRKYVAFSRRTCFPTMTEDAKDRIQEFYVDLRAEGTGEDAAVPVTARKLEALVRLAEASARVRLSDTVERADADRAVDIVHYCLKEIGMDPETGELDADVIETGTSKTQRDRVRNLLDIVTEIEEEYDDGAPVDVVTERAEEVGINSDKTEHEIQKLKQKGEVYEPQRGHLRTT